MPHNERNKTNNNNVYNIATSRVELTATPTRTVKKIINAAHAWSWPDC